MNNALNFVDEASTRSLDERLANNPELRERFHRLIDVIDAAAGDCVTAAQAETRVIEQIRKMGVEVLSAWSQRADGQAQQQVRTEHPKAVRDSKKNSTGIRSSEKSG
jgi:hypothetical protein